jgi:ribosomal protein S18 acetylase RimI-like enzyme
MKIRQADQHDYNGCLNIAPKAFRSPGFDARLGERLYNDYSFVAIDEPDNKIVGFLLCDSTFFDGEGFYLRTLAVDEKFRGKGIAEQLMRKAIKYAFASGARRVFADVTDDGAAQLLKRRGFERVGEINHMHAEGMLFQIYSLKVGAINLDA